VSIEVSFESPYFLGVSRESGRDRGSGAKVAELVEGVRGLKNILNLEVTMQEGWAKIMHSSNPLTDVDENLEDISLGEALA